jgi:hypothetical protein
MPERVSTTSRLREITQLILMLVSVAGAAEASRVDSTPYDPAERCLVSAGNSAGQSGRAADRRIGDLARLDRKRREDEQRRNRRGLELCEIHRTAAILRSAGSGPSAA